MKLINLPILQCDSEEEFKQFFVDNLVDKGLQFCGYDMKIIEEDFYHICFEKDKGDIEKGKFSVRRSRRLLLIKAVCDGTAPYKIIFQRDRENKSICILCEELESAIYLRPIVSASGRYFKLLTLIAFGEGVTKRIDKQLAQGEIIEDVEIVFKEAV